MRVAITFILLAIACLIQSFGNCVPAKCAGRAARDCLAPVLDAADKNPDGRLKVFEHHTDNSIEHKTEYIVSSPEFGLIKIINNQWFGGTYQIFLSVYDERTDEFVSLMQMYYHSADRELEMHEVYFGVRTKHRHLLARGRMGAAMRFCAGFVLNALFPDNGPYKFIHHGSPNLKLLSIFARIVERPQFCEYVNRSHKYPYNGKHWFRDGFLNGAVLTMDSTGDGVEDSTATIRDDFLSVMLRNKATVEVKEFGKTVTISCHVSEDEDRIILFADSTRDPVVVFDKKNMRMHFTDPLFPQKEYRMVFVQADKMIFMEGMVVPDLAMPDYELIDIQEVLRAA